MYMYPRTFGPNCENKVAFRERSYAHCSMYRYVHLRTFDSILGMAAAAAANAAATMKTLGIVTTV